MEFLKMEDTRPKLQVALILSYKMSTHANKNGELSSNEKTTEKNTIKQKLRERLKAVLEEKLQRSIENQFFLFFSCFLFIHGDVFDS